MKVLKEAFEEIFGDEQMGFSLSYTRRFKGYNANIKRRGSEITVNASSEWRGVSPEIQKGLFQELLVRLFKKKGAQTINMDLYHNFIRSLPKVIPKDRTHPVLESSFKRVNDQLFAGMMEQPNLVIGNGINRLGTYTYSTDTVAISSILLENETLMDYVMYHEMLHKKHQYTAKRARTVHHSTKFREDERRFPNAEELELELQKLVRKHKQKWTFW